MPQIIHLRRYQHDPRYVTGQTRDDNEALLQVHGTRLIHQDQWPLVRQEAERQGFDLDPEPAA